MSVALHRFVYFNIFTMEVRRGFYNVFQYMVLLCLLQLREPLPQIDSLFRHVSTLVVLARRVIEWV